MPMFWKKHESIEVRLSAYFDECDRCFEMYEKSFQLFLDSGTNTAYEAAVYKTHEAESAADDLRREIELELYGKALMPESRGDLLGLLENYDQLPGAAEGLLFEIMCQRMSMPAEFAAGFRQLLAVNLQAYYLVRKAADALMNNPRVTLAAVKEVDAKESESDRLERAITCQIFSSSLDKADKLQLKGLVPLIGRVSDLAEHTADRIGIINIKRKI